MYSRVRTSGIVTERYNIDGTTFEMYDVGGQRNERKKWIHCFEGTYVRAFFCTIDSMISCKTIFFILNFRNPQSSLIRYSESFFLFFVGVTAVIFVAAISEYDQKLFEDASTNRMVSTD